MNITEYLSQSGFSELLLKDLQNFCHELLPVQEQIIKNKMLFSEKNLLIHAPTSTGKTFLAELVMLHTSFQHRKSVYLVPLRVQAEEMFRTLRNRHKKYGLQILISTSDYRHHDPLLEQGRFHIAVVVYEKMFQLIARQPSILDKIQLIVFDDIDLIFDSERGTTADFLLTRCLGSSARCIALSACLPEPAPIAQWMKAVLIHSNIRPVPLKKGILYNGTFYYMDEHGNPKEEPFFDESLSESPLLFQTIQKLTQEEETCLIFMKTRNEVRALAWELAEYLHLPPAEQSVEQIKSLEPTRARDALLHAFQHGIGFHYSDLLPEERQIVEQAFRHRELRVLVATSTLSKGLNLPVDNVIISHEKWHYADKKGNGGPSPLSLPEYENMAGRAGRYGYSNQPARAILIATSEEEKNQLYSWYIQQSFPLSFPPNNIAGLNTPLLSVIASYQSVTMEHLEEFLRSSWRANEQISMNREPNLFSTLATDFMDSCFRRGFCIKKNLYRYGLTPRGVIIATKGVSPDTLEQLEQWLNTVRGRERDELDILLTASLTPDAWLPQFEFSLQEFQSKTYLQLLRETPLRTPWDVITPIQKFHQGLAEPHLHESKGLKIAFVLRSWICGKSLSEIEEEFAVSAGQVVQAGARISWILDVLVQLAELMSINHPDEFRILAEQVRWGIPVEGLSLARIFEGLLSRSQILTLLANGIKDIESVLKTSSSILSRYLPSTTILKLKQHAQKIRSKNFKFNSTSSSPVFKPKASQEPFFLQADKPITPERSYDLVEERKPKPLSSFSSTKTDTPKEETKYLLVLDMKRPGEVWVEGKKIRVPEKQYRLLCLLAQNAGCCVSYEKVYKELWNDIIVEDAQMAFQKCMLLRKLCEVSPEWKERLRTIPKRGFMLDLPLQQICMV